MSHEKPVDGTNREFLDYDQVARQQRYRFAERQGAEVFDEAFEVRTCDLSAWLHGDAAQRAAFVGRLEVHFEDDAGQYDPCQWQHQRRQRPQLTRN